MLYSTALRLSSSAREILMTILRGGRSAGPCKEPCHDPTIFWAKSAPAGLAAIARTQSISLVIDYPYDAIVAVVPHIWRLQSPDVPRSRHGSAGVKLGFVSDPTSAEVSVGPLSYTRGVDVPLLEMTLSEALTRAATRFPTRDGLIVCHQDVRLTWQELDREVTRVARGLAGLGLR